MTQILNDLSPRALATAIEANQSEFRADLGRSPRVEVHAGLDLMWYVTGIPSPSANGVCRARIESGDVDARVDATLRLFQARGLPFTWCTGPTTRPAGLGKHLVARGFVYAGYEPGMAVDLLALNDDRPAPPGLHVQRVRDEAALRRWFHIFALGFARPDFIRNALFDIEIDLGLGNYRRRLYVGSLEGEAVATSLLFLGAGVAGIYGVATLPEARRRGIGTAMTLTPLVEARAAGYRIGVLHASPMGLGVYRRLGFRQYCQLGFYGWTGERRG